LRRVLLARSCAMEGEDVVREVKGVDSRAGGDCTRRDRETFITELGEGRKTTLKGELKLRKAKATTLGIVLHARSYSTLTQFFFLPATWTGILL